MLQKFFCPICNKRFFVTEIEEQADLCLTRKTQRNIIDITNDSDAKETISYIDLNGDDTDKRGTTDTKSQLLSKIKSVLKNTIFTNGQAKLSIRHNFSFVDFCNYFTKTWNKPKLNMMYRVSEKQVKMMADFQENFIQVCSHRFCAHLIAFDTVIFHGPSGFTLTFSYFSSHLGKPFQFFKILRFFSWFCCDVLVTVF